MLSWGLPLFLIMDRSVIIHKFLDHCQRYVTQHATLLKIELLYHRCRKLCQNMIFAF